ncbi:MAG: radical SAM family heme chaperone HemW [Alphaproteobacteria bacterium]|nr:radical SAM family heme chaperone HemW [Alphaproteobacteria bacterium]
MPYYGGAVFYSPIICSDKMYKPEELAIYIHWPFCKSKCPYCDFYKEVNRNINQNDIIEEYLSALHRYYDLLPNRHVKSIFFGGGTPSLIEAKNIEKIIDFITKYWKISQNIEISLEANPNTRYDTMFKDFKNAGINRLSLGVQALNDDDLHFLGRSHNVKTARLCLQEIVQVFNNHSADLIYALPQQSLKSWSQQLEEICSFSLKHLSLYQLTIEENTVFARRGIKPLDEEKSVEIYNYTRNYLSKKNYKHYEVSNFAVSGYESKHNLTYWQGGEYIGIGKSAHGRICINNQHFAVTYPFNNEKLTSQQRAEELIIMGLRLTEGINKADFQNICGINFYNFINLEKLNQLKELGMLIESPTHVFVSYKGFLLIDAIIAELCS